MPRSFWKNSAAAIRAFSPETLKNERENAERFRVPARRIYDACADAGHHDVSVYATFGKTRRAGPFRHGISPR